MPDDNDQDDRKVKEMLEADLARWFTLPSIEQVEEQQAAEAPTDAEMEQVIERRAKACAAVDPTLVTAIHERTDENPRDLICFKPELEVQPYDLGIVDESLVAKIAAEPRMYGLPPELKDDMRDCTPQALLRDLHRPELEFTREMEVIDIAAETRVNVAEVVESVMTMRFKPDRRVSPLVETDRILAELRQRRRKSWLEGIATLPNRTVQE